MLYYNIVFIFCPLSFHLCCTDQRYRNLFYLFYLYDSGAGARLADGTELHGVAAECGIQRESLASLLQPSADGEDTAGGRSDLQRGQLQHAGEDPTRGTRDMHAMQAAHTG